MPRRGGFRLVVDSLYQAKADDVSLSMGFSPDFIASVLRDIYRSGHPRSSTDLSPQLFRAISEVVNKAVAEGISSSGAVSTPAADSDADFRHALRHSADVFSAFKVHRMQRDMGALLTDSNGDLKPFKQWANDVLPIASHQCGAWLRTEYDTAVLRAHQAADWQQFVREADVLPNLKWMPSTSPNPGLDHQVFWNTVRPIGDPFWSEHRPGDRWNCKCSLTSTDEPATATPLADKASEPQPGLSSNPGTDRAVFSQDHPYFPKSCSSCSFYKPGFKGKLRNLFTNRAKDCYSCPYIDNCITRMSSDGFKLEHKFKNGGKLYMHPDIDKDKADYKDMKRICLQLAKLGHEVRMTPRLHQRSDDYDKIYGALRGTKYEGKCPDFSVDGTFYEYEGFAKPWKKKKVGRMLSHGMEQSDHIVIKNTKGCSDRFLRKQIMARKNVTPNAIKDVWIYENGNIRPFLVNGKFIK